MNLFELAAKITLNADDYEKGIKAAMQLGDKAAEGMKKVSESSETAKSKVKSLSAQYDSAKDNVKKLTKELNESVKANGETSDKTKELAKALDKAEKEADQFEKELDQMQNSSEKAGKGLGGLTEKAEKFSAWAVAKGQLIASGIQKIGSALWDFGKSVVEVGASFEAQMSKVEAISGATAEEMDLLNAKAEEMGNKTQFSATEAGQAFEYMAMAGWKTHDMMNGIEGIMNLAAASGEDLASVSDIVTDALTAFGMKAEESAYFADVLATASSSSNTNVGMMGETFKYVAPVAGALGYRIDDVAIAIGLMANANVKGSQAGTALRSILTRLVKPTKDVKEAAEKLGISLSGNNSLLIDGKGEMRDFFDVMVTLRKAFSNLTETEKAETAAKLAGQEAMAGMLTIVNASEEDFWKLSEAIGEADGASEKMAKTMLNNLQGQMTMLSSSAESFKLALYNHVKQPLTEMAAWAVESLNGITTAFKGEGVEGLLAAAGDVAADALMKFVEKAPDMLEVAKDFIRYFIEGIENDDGRLGEAAFEAISAFILGIGELLPDIINAGVDLLVNFANGMANGSGEVVPKAVEIVAKIVKTLADRAPDILKAGLQIVIALAKGIIDSLPELLKELPQIIGTIVGFIIESLPDILEAGVEILMELVAGIIGSLDELYDAAWEMIKKVLEAIADGWENLKEAGRNIVSKIADGIADAWDGVVDWFNGLWDDLTHRSVDIDANVHEDGTSGSFAGGIEYVPKDGYRAILHKGERVLTADENRQYGSRGSGMTLVQHIQTVPQTPAEFGAITEKYLREARWL